jgi:hypothetical protein
MLEAIDASTRDVRNRLVDTALGQADRGAHYLMGCFGAAPGGSDNVCHRRLDLGEHTDWDNLSIHAGEHRNTQRPETIRCAGRFERAHGQIISGSDLERRVRDYLTAHAAEPFENWPLFEGIGYPRKAWDEFQERYLYVIGEDCRNKSHFDCLGFVSWVLTQIKGSEVRYGASQWVNPRIAPVTVREGTPQLRDLEPADLLVRYRPGDAMPHIVIVAYNQNIVEAAGIRAGVIKQPCDVNRFTHHCRLTNRWFRTHA